MRTHRSLQNRIRNCLPLAVALSFTMVLTMVTPANSCPFCSAVARTFTEQMESSDIVVIATMKSEPEAADSSRLPEAKFQISTSLKGVAKVGDDFIAVVVSRKVQIGDRFLVMGSGTDAVNWTTPLKVSDTVVEYLSKLHTLPEKGVERLTFFAQFFEHEETILAYDAYDEFARAPYTDVKALKDSLDSDKLIGWLKDPEVMQSRKRLYYTLLGVIGPNEERLAFLEEIITSGDRDKQSGLDALIACYLTLKGEDGMKLVESTFLDNPDAEYIDVYSAILALRFHGTEAEIISKPRLVEALRYVLDRPRMADMVIPDLARWEDWSVMNQLAKMFKDCDTDETRWVRTPIITYLQACPKPEAKVFIEEFREIDPDAVKRAEMLADLDWGDDDDDEDEMSDEELADEELNEKSTDDTNKEEEPDDDASEVTVVKKQQTLQSTGVLVEQRKACEKQQDGDEEGQVDAMADDVSETTVSTLAVNPAATSYVSTNEPAASKPTLDGPALAAVSNSAAPPLVPVADPAQQLENEQLAQRSAPAPPAAIIVPAAPSALVMILAGLGICAILFLLLWSVLNGSFERLIS